MKKASKALAVELAMVFSTSAVYFFADLDLEWQRLLPIVLAAFTWNIYAYAFDRGMWPRQFVELDGYGKGYPMAREAVFWASAVVYLLLLATIVFAS